MTSMYPQARDTFRRVVDDADEMHAQLLRDLFDSIIAVQTELGVKPAGPYGSIFGRIFGSELVSETCGYWRKLHFEIVPTDDAHLRGSTDFPTAANWAAGRMAGTNTNMGDKTPFVFTVYQGRGIGSSFFDLGTRVLGQAWHPYPWRVREDRCFIAATTADYGAPQAGGTQQAEIGVIAWGLQPNPVHHFEES